MPVTDAYATAVEYRARVGQNDTSEDVAVLAQLTAVSRLIDKECGRFFTKDAADVVRVFDGNGTARIYVADISEIPALLRVDLSGDWLYTGASETLTHGTHYWAGPWDADKGSEPHPYTFLDLVPDNGVLTEWPCQAKAVEVTAQFGWPAAPGAIKEAAILVTREIRDLQAAGPLGSLQAVDSVVQLSPEAFAIVQRIKRRYGRPRPGSVDAWFA